MLVSRPRISHCGSRIVVQVTCFGIEPNRLDKYYYHSLQGKDRGPRQLMSAPTEATQIGPLYTKDNMFHASKCIYGSQGVHVSLWDHCLGCTAAPDGRPKTARMTCS